MEGKDTKRSIKDSFNQWEWDYLLSKKMAADMQTHKDATYRNA